jgi:glycosyltransferase involved in cell wall biosynthesis
LDWSLTKIERSARKWDRVFYHGYIKNSFESISNNINSDPLWGDKKVFLFVGTFGKSYELELIINVARRYNEMQNSDIGFCIAGTGDQYDSLKEKVAKLPNVSLPGWVDNSHIQRFLQCAWAGIVPCRSVENAAPNKVFEYLSAGLPLVSSLEGEIADLIQRHRIGVNYKAGDSEDLYQCINKLSGDTNLRNNMSQAASFFFREFGDADRIYDEYANHIEKLVEYKNEFVKSS